MRKPISILLLLVFLFQSVGCLVIFKLQQLQVRNEVKHHLLSNLPDSELEIIKISRHEQSDSNSPFHFWESDEFSYSGKMYDVIRREDHGNTTWYYCFPDTRETHVLSQLNKFVKDQMAHDPKKQKQRDEFQRLLNSLFHAGNQQYSFVDEFRHPIQMSYSFHIKTWSCPPLTHPPKLA